MADLREQRKLRLELQELADEIMSDRGLKPVTVKFNRRLRVTAGQYHGGDTRCVEIGTWVLDSQDDVLDIFLHEMAHAVTTQVTPRATSHGIQWKLQCVELGAYPDEHYNLTNPALALKVEATRRPLVTYFRCSAPARLDPCEMKYRNKPRKDFADKRFSCRKHSQPFVRIR